MGKAMEQHVQGNLVSSPSRHGFVKGMFWFASLISFYDKATHLVDYGKDVHVVYSNLSKAFNTVSHSILMWMVWLCG